MQNLPPYAEATFTTTDQITAGYGWAVSNTPSSLDSQVGDQLAQIHPAQPPAVHASPTLTSILNFPTPANYSENHHLDH